MQESKKKNKHENNKQLTKTNIYITQTFMIAL